MPLRVLMIGPGETVVGGISALVQTLLPALQERVDLRLLQTARQRPVNRSGRISVENLALAVSQYFRFLGLLAQFRPRIVHVHTSQGIAWFKDTFYIIVAKACGCSVVLHMHGGNFWELYAENAGLVQLYSQRALSLADAVIEVSAERARRLASTIPTAYVLAFRNCIDVDAIAPGSPDRPANGLRALFMGVLGPSKGTFDLLNAMDRLRSGGCSLKLWIAGDEERQGDLATARRLLQELDLGEVCELVGVVRGASKLRMLSEAGLFVLPSYEEALPMAILEAMAAGLPIVTTAVGGIPEIVRDGYNGFMVKPGDVEALADKLAILAGDQPLRETMGRRSREIAEQELDVKPYVKRLVTLYDSLAGQGGLE